MVTMIRRSMFFVLFLLALAMVGNTAAYVYTFQDGDVSDFTGIKGNEYTNPQTTYTPTTGAYPYSDTICARFYTSVGRFNGFKHLVSYPTNYWAYTVRWFDAPYSDGYFKLYNSNGAQSASISFSSHWIQPRFQGERIEFVRDGSTVYYYRNGALSQTMNIGSTIPYFWGIYLGSGNYYVGRTYGIDDVVVGTNEERDVVSCPPQGWWLAKDIFDPGFSGLYSAYNTQVYTDSMHISYANDDGSATINIKHVPTGEIVYSETVSNYAGIITIDLSDVFFDSGAPYGKYRVYSEGTTAYDTITYKGVAITGTNIFFDAETYEDNDPIGLSYNISESHWIPTSYTYKVCIQDQGFDEVESWVINDRPAPGSKDTTVSETNYPNSGYYYACLYAIDRSSGEEILLEYDEAYIDVSWTDPGSVTLKGRPMTQ